MASSFAVMAHRSQGTVRGTVSRYIINRPICPNRPNRTFYVSCSRQAWQGRRFSFLFLCIRWHAVGVGMTALNCAIERGGTLRGRERRLGLPTLLSPFTLYLTPNGFCAPGGGVFTAINLQAGTGGEGAYPPINVKAGRGCLCLTTTDHNFDHNGRLLRLCTIVSKWENQVKSDFF